MIDVRGRRVLGRVAVLSALLLAAAPAGAQAFSKAIWGNVYRNGVNQFPLYHQLGVSIYEADLDWSDIAPTRPHRPTNPNDPAYRWPAEVHQAITQARRFHMRVLLQIIFTPPWANRGRAPNYPPVNPADYAAFATAAARRYPSVDLWMIWGEPDRQPNFAPTRIVPPGRTLTRAQRVAPHDYARILDAAYGALKRVGRRNLVIGGCTYSTGSIDTQQWIKNLRLPDGRAPRMDMYAHNPFTDQEPSFSVSASPFGEVQFSDLPELGQWIDRYLRPGMPIFLSEFTIPTAIDTEFNFFVDPSVAAQWITDALRLSRSWKRIYALGWIHVYDDPPITSGGLMTAQGVPKPSFAAFEHG
jgi:hypothetical protein